MELVPIIEKIIHEKGYSLWILLIFYIIFYLSIKIKPIISFNEWNKKRKIILYKDLIEITDDENIIKDIKENIRKKIFLNINNFSADENYRNEYYKLIETKNFSKEEINRAKNFLSFDKNLKVKITFSDKIFAYYNLIVAIYVILQTISIFYLISGLRIKFDTFTPYLLIAFIILSFLGVLLFINEYLKYRYAIKLKAKLENYYTQLRISSPETPLPEVPLPEVPLPEVPLPEVPLPEVPLPEIKYILKISFFEKFKFNFFKLNKFNVIFIINLIILYFYCKNFKYEYGIIFLFSILYFSISLLVQCIYIIHQYYSNNNKFDK